MEAMRARRPMPRTLATARRRVLVGAQRASSSCKLPPATALSPASWCNVVARRDLLDKPLALTSPTPQVIDDELVPIGEAPGRFDGFDKRGRRARLGRSVERGGGRRQRRQALSRAADDSGRARWHDGRAEAAQGLDGRQGGRADERPDGQAVPGRLRRRQSAVRAGPGGRVPAAARQQHAPGVRTDRLVTERAELRGRAGSTSPSGSPPTAATCPPRWCRRVRTRCRRRRS